MPRPITGMAWDGSSPFLMARVFNDAGTQLLQANVSSMQYKSTDISAPTVLISGPTTLTIADVVFNSYQDSDDRWENEDSVGYNVAFTLATAAIPLGNRKYDINLQIVLGSGAVIPVVWRVSTTKQIIGT